MQLIGRRIHVEARSERAQRAVRRGAQTTLSDFERD